MERSTFRCTKNSKEAKKYAKILWRQSKYLDSIKWYLIYLNKNEEIKPLAFLVKYSKKANIIFK